MSEHTIMNSFQHLQKTKYNDYKEKYYNEDAEYLALTKM